MTSGSFAVIGGDMRFWYLAEMLKKRGYEVASYGLEKAPRGETKKARSLRSAVAAADYIVLPMRLLGEDYLVNAPFAKTPIDYRELLAFANKNAMLFAGVVSPSAVEATEMAERKILDYGRQDDLTIRNAIPMALGIRGKNRGEIEILTQFRYNRNTAPAAVDFENK